MQPLIILPIWKNHCINLGWFISWVQVKMYRRNTFMVNLGQDYLWVAWKPTEKAYLCEVKKSQKRAGRKGERFGPWRLAWAYTCIDLRVKLDFGWSRRQTDNRGFIEMENLTKSRTDSFRWIWKYGNWSNRIFRWDRLKWGRRIS